MKIDQNIGIPVAFLYLTITTLGVAAFIYSDSLLTIPDWPDDAFYYHSIARNLALGKGFTADGLTTTTGFHPLWLGVLVPVAGVCIQSKTAFIASSILLQGILSSLGWLLLFGTLKRWSRTSSGIHQVAVVLIASLPVTVSTLMGGKESALAFFLISAYIFLLSRSLVKTGKPSIVTGIVMVLCVLTRLNLVFLAMGVFIALSLNDHRKVLVNIMLVLAPATAALLFWSACLLLIDGHPVPISAFLKTRESWAFNPSYPILRLPLMTWVLPAGTLIVGWLIIQRFFKRTRNAHLLTIIGGLVLACLAQVLSISVLQRCWLGPWYGISAFPLAILLVAAIPKLIDKGASQSSVRIGLWALSATLMFSWVMQARQTSIGIAVQYEHARSISLASQWLDSHVEKTALAACSDSGRLGFFSETPIVNLDGLANGYEYQDRLRQEGIQQYLTDNRIRYYVIVWPYHLRPSIRRNLAMGSYERIEIRIQDKQPYLELGYPTDSLMLRRDSEVMRHEQLGEFGFQSYIWDLRAE